jgi:hypothetical protein
MAPTVLQALDHYLWSDDEEVVALGSELLVDYVRQVKEQDFSAFVSAALRLCGTSDSSSISITNTDQRIATRQRQLGLSLLLHLAPALVNRQSDWSL